MGEGIDEIEGIDYASQYLISDLREKLGRYETALRLIATPKRPDGTYNRCREACEELAKEALQEY